VKYLQKSFTVTMGSPDYRANYGKIDWGTESETCEAYMRRTGVTVRCASTICSTCHMCERHHAKDCGTEG
jgi:hypothetical protein